MKFCYVVYIMFSFIIRKLASALLLIEIPCYEEILNYINCKDSERWVQ